MTKHYKENNFSTEKFLTSYTEPQKNMDKIARPNIDHLIKRILLERRKKKKNSTILGVFCLSIIFGFIFFQS